MGLSFAATLIAISGCKTGADSQNLQGVKLYQQGQFQPALQQFQQAMAADPKNADAYYNMAATQHRMGVQANDQQMLAQAEKAYNQCLDLNPNHADCHRGLAVLLVETGRPDRAFNLLKNWATANPTSAEARIELARLYEEFGDLETAKVQLNQAIVADQNSARAWAALGRLREKTGDYQQALANSQRSWSLNSLQTGIAERIASLNQALQSSVSSTTGTAAQAVTATGSPPMR